MFQDQLFISAGAKLERIVHFACGHVVPPDSVLPLIIKSGPSGKFLDFTFQHRDTPETYLELSRTLVNVCNVIPGGIVIFFPSYDYETR
jgi:chromosome transmission fidelity protein 1